MKGFWSLTGSGFDGLGFASVPIPFPPFPLFPPSPLEVTDFYISNSSQSINTNALRQISNCDCKFRQRFMYKGDDEQNAATRTLRYPKLERFGIQSISPHLCVFLCFVTTIVF